MTSIAGLVSTAFLFSDLSIGRAEAENRVTLVIGNGAYASQPLDNSPNDAALMVRTLESVGFKVISEIDADGPAMKRAVHKVSRAPVR